jgi:large subunit ribosomal protein L29
MKVEALKAMSDEELAQAETNAVEDLFRLRFQHNTGQLSKTSVLKNTRQTVARIKTLRGERAAQKENANG